jgi:ABC-type glycerol-3-phosphate transport system permease component
MKIAIPVTVFNIIFSSMAGYAFARLRFKFRDAIFMMFIASMMVPYAITLIPRFLMFRTLGFYDTYVPLIVPAMFGTAFSIFLTRQFFMTLPKELEEAAIIDGANDFQVLLRVYLPLSMASLATLTLFYAVGKWNSFQDALYYISNKAYQPLQLKLYHIIKGSQAVDVAALEGGASTVATSVSESIEPATIIFATLPILVVYPFVQRYFVAGVTIGAVKG